MLKKLLQMIAPKAPESQMSPEQQKRFKKLFENAAKIPGYQEYTEKVGGSYGW